MATFIIVFILQSARPNAILMIRFLDDRTPSLT